MSTPSAAPPASKGRSKTTAKKAASSVERDRNVVSHALGQSLKAIRIAKDMSQEQLAGSAEVDRTLVSRIERGVANPSLLTLSTICYVLDVSLSELLTPVTKNLKPRWMDPKSPKRRTNQASGESRPAPSRRLR